jgi:hypothetical protein
MSKGNTVLNKLREQLELGIFTEANAVYFMSLLRKCLEIDSTKDRFKYLNLYCNWALHSRIDSAWVIAESIESLRTGGNISDFLDFKRFNGELLEFIKSKNIATSFLDNQKEKLRFLNCLVEVFHYCPLFVTSGAVRYKVELVPSGVVTKGGIYSMNVFITPLIDSETTSNSDNP